MGLVFCRGCLSTEADASKKKRVTQPDGTTGKDYNLQTTMGLVGDDRGSIWLYK
jgi:hypothetical protein